MTRYLGMYRRSELIRRWSPLGEAERAAAATLLVRSNCTANRHCQETDSKTGNEICRYCGVVIDDYSDVLIEVPNPDSDSTKK